MNTRHAQRWIAVLVAWMLSFQALAGVGVIPCVHSGQPAAAMAKSMDMSSMAGMTMEQHRQHMQHAAKSDSAGKLAAKLMGCGCGCSCVGHCAMSGSALASHFASTLFPSYPSSPITRQLPVSLASAHGLDLFRPPSIS